MTNIMYDYLFTKCVGATLLANPFSFGINYSPPWKMKTDKYNTFFTTDSSAVVLEGEEKKNFTVKKKLKWKTDFSFF